jgi:hypothetical protein
MPGNHRVWSLVGDRGFPVTIPFRMKLIRLAMAALALSAPACYDFHTVGPEDPPLLKLPQSVAVTVEYLRPAVCVLPAPNCGGPVTFHASWMKNGAYVTLTETAAHTWTAHIPDVPINYPGNDPYRVYAVDPFLSGTETGGVSAERLTIGGERIISFEFAGGRNEHGLIYIDANGKGRTP